MVMKPKLDTRDIGMVRSRALNTEMMAVLIDENGRVDNQFSIYEQAVNQQPDYIFVDEVNFLKSEDIDELAKIVDNLNIPVFGYGLMIDYKGFLFEGSKRMVELADTIRELKSPCIKCSKKATMHLRKINDKYVFEGNSIEVGDMDAYESVCRKCYQKAKQGQ